MEGHMGPGAWRYVQSVGHSHLQGVAGAGIDTGPHGVWFGSPLFDAPLSAVHHEAWQVVLGLEGVSCHNTCAAGGPGCPGQDRTAPGQRPCAQPGRAWEDMPQ